MRYPKLYILIVCVISSFWSCEKGTQRTNNIADYIPQNSESVIKIANLETTTNDLDGSHLFKQLDGAHLGKFLKEHVSFISKLQPSGEMVLSFQKHDDSTQHFTLITRSDTAVFTIDSLMEATSEKITHKGYTIQSTNTGTSKNYIAKVDSMFLASSSEVILKEIIDNKTEADPVFKRAYSLKTRDGLVTLTQPRALPINDSTQINLASQAALEVQVYPDGVNATGVILDRDTVPQLLTVFRGLQPQQNKSAQIVPIEALSARAITYNDAELLAQNLQKYHKKNHSLAPIFGSINELTEITLEVGKALALRSIDPTITQDEFGRYISETEKFREVMLYSISEESLSFAAFYPLMDFDAPNLAFQLDDFFVFVTSEAAAKQLISAYKNNATLVNASYYENTVPQLSQASSYSIYNLQGNLDSWTSAFLLAEKSTLEKFPLSVLQLSYDRDFAHINLVCKEASQKQESSGLVTQLFAQSLDAALLSPPQFFSNHRTRGKDVVVQDISNKLYLISASGKLLWKKQLDGPVLGTIQEVDLLRNGKKQLAFTTDKTFYILDRNGKGVGPFPKKFNDGITQPLSIFDYDNRRNYRFVITQGTKVFMYDREGRIVTGFTYKKADSDIVLPPQHIRLGNKDYLLIAEKNGKLNILSRVGKERIKVNKKFSFSEMPIAREGLSFVVITKENTKESISQSGKVTSNALNVADNYWFGMRGNTKVTLDDNLLRINGKLVELPFGVYTQPQITVSNRKTYITVTDEQEKKVFLFDKDGTLLKGFPIYGSGPASLGNAKNNKKNAVVVQGSEDEVILYSLD